MDIGTASTTRVDDLRIDGRRLWDSLMVLACIGATARGRGLPPRADRPRPPGARPGLAMGPRGRPGRDHRPHRQRLPEAWGRDDRLPPVVTGSHIDTQPTGGKFDGNDGVLAGLEVVRTLNDHGIETIAPIEVHVEAVALAARKLGHSHMPVVSGAGHDAVYMARLAPADMVFVPCEGGIGHNEIEDAQPEHLAAGCNVLLHAMRERAGVAPAMPPVAV